LENENFTNSHLPILIREALNSLLKEIGTLVKFITNSTPILIQRFQKRWGPSRDRRSQQHFFSAGFVQNVKKGIIKLIFYKINEKL